MVHGVTLPPVPEMLSSIHWRPSRFRLIPKRDCGQPARDRVVNAGSDSGPPLPHTYTQDRYSTSGGMLRAQKRLPCLRSLIAVTSGSEGKQPDPVFQQMPGNQRQSGLGDPGNEVFGSQALVWQIQWTDLYRHTTRYQGPEQHLG